MHMCGMCVCLCTCVCALAMLRMTTIKLMTSYLWEGNRSFEMGEAKEVVQAGLCVMW